MQNLMTKFVKDESGATAIGDQLNKKFDDVAGEIGTAADNNTAANQI